MAIQNLFEHLPSAKQAEIFETLVQTPQLKIERIISYGQKAEANTWYDQPQAEWVLLVKGAAIIEYQDGSSQVLKPGDHLNITPRQKHRVAWTDPSQETLWLAVHYATAETAEP